MAKSKSFFGLRRGSTKSHTYSVLNGQQITKDRVQSVANPKTQKQQFQRAIMATVMAAYSEMKAIEDHAFQGKKKGSENQREFMSRNLVAMRNAFLSYQEDNPTPGQQKFFAVGPKTPTVLPCEWILSHGTMPEQKTFNYNDGNHIITLPEISDYEEVSGNHEATLGSIAEQLGLKTGMQITFVCVTMGAGRRIYQIYPEDYAGYSDWSFGYCRFVVGSFDSTDRLSVLAENHSGLYTLFFRKVCDLTRTTPSLYTSLLEDMVATEKQIATYDAEFLLSGAGFDESLTGGIGIITSMVDEDLRSTSKMLLRGATDFKQSLGLAWEYVPDAWRNAGGNLGQSDLYLEGGSV